MINKPRAVPIVLRLLSLKYFSKDVGTPKHLNTGSVLKLQVGKSSGVYFRSSRKSLRGKGLCVQKGYEITEMKAGLVS